MPYATIDKYKEKTGWKKFSLIVEKDNENSINDSYISALTIKSETGRLIVEGAEDGLPVNVYTLDGILIGSAISRNGAAIVNTFIPHDSVAIVKIGNRSFKVMMKKI